VSTNRSETVDPPTMCGRSRPKNTCGANLRLVPGLGLVDFEGAGLPETLAQKVETELELSATHIRHRLLSAAINVGLDVFSQFSWPLRWPRLSG